MKALVTQRIKSGTYWLGLGVGGLGLVEANFHLVQEYLGDKAGLVNLGIMLAIFALREITTKPLSDK